MNKKLILVLTIFLLSTTVLTNTAFAKKSFVHFDEIYMTDAYGSYAERTTYGWDEIPWLYLRLPEDGFNFTRAWWESPGGDRYLTRSISREQEIWFSLDDWYDVREIGEWDIIARFHQPHSSHPFGIGKTSFTVTPEPVSSILFVAGGATLVIRRFLRRNKN